jgi:hypothetical protein
MSRFFHWYTALTDSDVNWTKVVLVALTVSILVCYVEAWLSREREDKRDDEVRMLRLQVENLIRSNPNLSKTVRAPMVKQTSDNWDDDFRKTTVRSPVSK